MIPLRRRARQLWRTMFPPRALRIPGKWPWVQPPPLPFGTPLFNGVVADGKGGVMSVPDRPLGLKVGRQYKRGDALPDWMR